MLVAVDVLVLVAALVVLAATLAAGPVRRSRRTAAQAAQQATTGSGSWAALLGAAIAVAGSSIGAADRGRLHRAPPRSRR